MKKTNVFRYCCVLILLFSCFIVRAQEYVGFNMETKYNKWFVKTPEVASMLANTAYPVNYSTGTVNIQIPLYEVKCGDLVLPIYLSYNSTGIKVNEPLGWVGQNWTLHAEPQVAFIPHGNIDNNNEKGFESGKHYSYEQVSNMSSYAFQSDFLPDEYAYTLLNKSGKYMYSNKKRKYVTFPHDDIIISQDSIIDTDGTKYIFNGGFDLLKPYSSSVPREYITCRRASEIIAANGVDVMKLSYENKCIVSQPYHNDNIVVEEMTCRSEEKSSDFGAWNTMQTLHHYDKQINCQEPLYRHECFFHPRVFKSQDGRTNSYQVTFGKTLNGSTLLYSDGCKEEVDSKHDNLVNYIESKRLSSITCSNCTVKFIMGSEDINYNLERIEIYNNIDTAPIKIIKFSYKKGQSYRKRNFLSSITTSSKGYSEVTRFDYNETIQIPDPGTRQVDFWGYFNASASSTEIGVPLMKLNVIKDINIEEKSKDTLYIGSSIKRGAKEEDMIKGMLNKITYPTGATCEFVFESNRAKIERQHSISEKYDFHIVDQLYHSLSGDTKDIYQLGGLRIKEITTKDRDEKILQQRTFEYGENNDGIGQTRIVDGVNYFYRSQTKCYNYDWVAIDVIGNCVLKQNIDKYGQFIYTTYQNWNRELFTRTAVKTLVTEPTIPIDYPNGASVMYRKVTEYNGTKLSNVGKTEYYYKVITNQARTDGAVYLFPTLYDTDYTNGLLECKKVYKKVNSVYKAIESYTYSHSTKLYTEDKIEGCQFYIDFYADYDPSFVVGSYKSCPISLTSGTVLQTGIVHSIYDCGLSVRKQYCYDDTCSNLLTSMTCSDDDKTVTERYYYPKDSANISPYKDMLSKNIISPVIKTEIIDNDKYLCQKADYKAFTNKNNAGFYEPVSISQKYSETGQFENRLNYKYDDNANLVEQVENGIPTVYIWSYKGEYPVASISNCTYEQLKSFISKNKLDEINKSAEPTSSHWTLINNIRTRIKDGDLKSSSMGITTYTYNPLVGMTSQTDAKGLTIEYEYDSFGRLSHEYVKQPDGNRQLVKQYEYKYASQR